MPKTLLVTVSNVKSFCIVLFLFSEVVAKNSELFDDYLWRGNPADFNSDTSSFLVSMRVSRVSDPNKMSST